MTCATPRSTSAARGWRRCSPTRRHRSCSRRRPSDPAVARHWFDVFEGAGLDGVIAKRADLRYLPGKREMAKIKHLRTADCVVAGFRWHKNGPGTMVGSLLLGLWNDAGQLQHVGVTSSFTEAKRARAGRVPGAVPARTRSTAIRGANGGVGGRGCGRAAACPAPRQPLEPRQGPVLGAAAARAVCEVAFDHLQGDRFRHGTTFKRWRPDKSPADCRYDQLEETPAALLADLFGGR